MAEENKEKIIINESSSEYYDDIINKTFFKKYNCVKKLGEGSFGRIYQAEYNGKKFALKFEDKKKGQSLLESEASIMNYLRGPHIPEVVSYGYVGDYNILVMQLMGKSLEDLFNELKIFTVKTACMLGYQMVTALQYIHDRHILHRDIKPDNFVMGLSEYSHHVYLLDFGLAKKYRSSKTLVQYPLINKKKLTGTARYASINALRGFEQSRRDDLEAVGYVLMYFIRGELPWQGLPGKNKDERYKKILQKKIDTSPEELCKGYPKEFEKYIEYTRGMEYTEQPAYDRLRGYFLTILENEEEKFDFIYDWTSKDEKRKYKERKLNLETGYKKGLTLTSSKKADCCINDTQKNIQTEDKKEERINNNGNNNIEEGEDNSNINKVCVFRKVSTKEYANTIPTERKKRRKTTVEENKKENTQEEVCCSSACIIF